MTAIQIKYLEYLENKRKNLAQEGLTREQLAIERDKLAETVTNNLRNYKINVDKNKIQALYNRQLNDREVAKLAESIRHNVEEELRKREELLEMERHNKRSESQKDLEIEIRNYELLLNALTGRSKDLPTGLFDWLKNLVTTDLVTGGKFSQNTWNYISGIISPNSYSDQSNNKADTYDPNTGKWTYVENSTNKPTYSDLPKNAPSHYHVTKRSAIEKDEIPQDVSNSYGPGNQSVSSETGGPDSRISGNRSNVVIAPSNTKNGPGENQTSSRSTYPSVSKYISGGPGTTADTRISNSSAVIYSPGTKIGPGW